MRIGIVGFGYMGKARLNALHAIRDSGIDLDVVGIVDPSLSAVDVGRSPSSRILLLPDLDSLLNLKPQWVIIAATHRASAQACKQALAGGVQVLLEKPMGRNLAEAKELVARQVRKGQLCVGLNYRFFEGIGRLLLDVRKEMFGPLVSASLQIGHGHQPGMERSWKLDPREAGGGVLIDPGSHMLDLARLLAGDDLAPVSGLSYQGFWKNGVEEECHVLLHARDLPVVNLSVSIVRWRSTFRVEVFGQDGYGIVEGRDRSYGPQTYRRGRRWAWRNGLPQRETETLVCRSDGADVFERELRALLVPGEDAPLPPSSAESALATMALIDACQRVVNDNSHPL
jgi:1,5-anhydro-D-fructose reductase (1,5-anhydro-D-mannitol-forming)